MAASFTASHWLRRWPDAGAPCPRWAFLGGIVGLGILAPLALQGLELGQRIPHTVVPAVLVLAGGFTLRWVMVNAGQASHIVQAGAM